MKNYTMGNYMWMIILCILAAIVTLIAIFGLANGYTDTSILSGAVFLWLIVIIFVMPQLREAIKAENEHEKMLKLQEESKENYFKYFNENKFVEYFLNAGASEVSKKCKIDTLKYPVYESERFTMINGRYTYPTSEGYERGVRKISDMQYFISFKEPHDKEFFDKITEKYRGAAMRFTYINETFITAIPYVHFYTNENIENIKELIS